MIRSAYNNIFSSEIINNNTLISSNIIHKIIVVNSNNSKDKINNNDNIKDNKLINASYENTKINLSKPIRENDLGINTLIITPSINPEINTLINTSEILLAKKKVNDNVCNKDNNIINLSNNNKQEYTNWPRSLIKFTENCIARGGDYDERSRITIKLHSLISSIANEGRLHTHRWDLEPILRSPDGDDEDKEEIKERRKVKIKDMSNNNMITNKISSPSNIINNNTNNMLLSSDIIDTSDQSNILINNNVLSSTKMINNNKHNKLNTINSSNMTNNNNYSYSSDNNNAIKYSNNIILSLSDMTYIKKFNLSEKNINKCKYMEKNKVYKSTKTIRIYKKNKNRKSNVLFLRKDKNGISPRYWSASKSINNFSKTNIKTQNKVCIPFRSKIPGKKKEIVIGEIILKVLKISKLELQDEVKI